MAFVQICQNLPSRFLLSFFATLTFLRRAIFHAVRTENKVYVIEYLFNPKKSIEKKRSDNKLDFCVHLQRTWKAICNKVRKWLQWNFHL